MPDDGRLPVLLGEAPSKGGDRYWMLPLSGRPSRVLCELAGIEPLEGESAMGQWTWALRERFECINLFERYAQATPWPTATAIERAFALRPDLDRRIVVCLGRRVNVAMWKALGMPKISRAEFHVWRHGAGEGPASLVAVPHPSGLNRLLNDSAERLRTGETLREALRLASVI